MRRRTTQGGDGQGAARPEEGAPYLAPQYEVSLSPGCQLLLAVVLVLTIVIVVLAPLTYAEARAARRALESLPGDGEGEGEGLAAAGRRLVDTSMDMAVRAFRRKKQVLL